ncbi:MAG: tRNA pseudouridine(55) synthase TruB [Candidatus Uhrbacteria bacterium]|nr:tRNA pseudouridine(55) synthase TruB [Patescibacteria group bacterium]MBU1906871.1 tRNA pseudouridine(55) synthase TruB [Patescibacteria group bacterium]
MQGLLLIDKPAGMTSHDVVDRVRRLTGIRKVGHAGTLDPFATGLLILGIGPATKQLTNLVGLDKEYGATFVLGARSETDDPEGPIEPDAGAGHVLPNLTRNKIESAMQKYLGEIEQVPPQYAAIKIKGKKMYELARAGHEVKAEPRKVRIDEYELLEMAQTNGHSPQQQIKVRIKCGSGTYIRALARDLGEDLKVGGYVSELRRTTIGSYRIEDAMPLNDLTPENISTKLLTGTL